MTDEASDPLIRDRLRELECGADVFAGFRVRTDTGLYESRPSSQDRIRPERRLRDAAPRPPAHPTPYSGPTACATLDGCLRD